MTIVCIVRSHGGGSSGGGGGGSLSVVATASRTSGVAPFAVMVDTIDSTSTDPTVNTFHEMGVYHVFGETGLGTWPYTGQDRNIDFDPIAAHCYETPGEFVYKVKGRDSSGGAHDGDVSQDTITFTVLDPDEVYAGTATVVLSMTSSAPGAPAGALVLTNLTEWPDWASDTRYLLLADQDFTSLGPIEFTSLHDSQWGKLGSGADPIVHTIMGDTSDPVSSNWSARLTFYDLNVNEEDGSTAGYSILFGVSSDDICILRGRTTGVISFGKNINYFFTDPDNKVTTEVSNAIYRPKGTFVFETDVGDTLNTSGRHIAAYGVYADGPTEHDIRLWQGYKIAVRHCRLRGVTDSSKHNVKIHAAGVETPYQDKLSDSEFPASRYGVIGPNDIGAPSDANTQAVNLGPQSGQAYAVEGCEDFIAVSMTFNKTYNHNVGLGGRRMTSRGNGTVVTSYNIEGKAVLEADWDENYTVTSELLTVEAPT